VMMPPSFEEWTSQGPQVGTMIMKMIVLINMIVTRNILINDKHLLALFINDNYHMMIRLNNCSLVFLCHS
jgi:hypothetical protein